jgi:hypothetical protein
MVADFLGQAHNHMGSNSRLRLHQQVRQLGDVGRDPPRLVAGILSRPPKAW